jgi:hypothetical protein
VFWGGTLSGAVLILFFLYSGTAMVAAGIAVLGLAHALSVPNQAKLVSQLSVVQSVGIGPGLGMYRQLERVGNVIAPIAAGLLMTRMPFGTALGIIGAYTVASSCLFRLLFRPVTDGEGP